MMFQSGLSLGTDYPSDKQESEASISLRSLIDSYVQTNIFPGAMLSIYNKDGEEVWNHISPPTQEIVEKAENSKGKAGYGEAYTPAQYHQDTLLRIYSMTKPMCTALTLIAATKKLLDLDDPVEKFLPYFTPKVYVAGAGDNIVLEEPKKKITIRHLLTHTSGISYGFFGNNHYDINVKKKFNNEDISTWFTYVSTEELCKALSDIPLLFHPGEKFHYGLSFDILGHILEIVFKKDLDQVFQEYLLEPLEMYNTFFSKSDEELYDLAPVFEISMGFSVEVSNNKERLRNKQGKCLKSAGGGLVSTLNDYSKFTTFLLNDGVVKFLDGSEKRLIDSELMAQINQNQFEIKNLSTFEYSYEKSAFSESVGQGTYMGLGVSVVEFPNKVKGGSLSSPGEYGWGGVAATNFTIDPVRKFSSIFMTQLIGGAGAYPIRVQIRYLLNKLLNELIEQSETA